MDLGQAASNQPAPLLLLLQEQRQLPLRPRRQHLTAGVRDEQGFLELGGPARRDVATCPNDTRLWSTLFDTPELFYSTHFWQNLSIMAFLLMMGPHKNCEK